MERGLCGRAWWVAVCVVLLCVTAQAASAAAVESWVSDPAVQEMLKSGKVAMARACNIGKTAWLYTGDWLRSTPMETTGDIEMAVIDATMTDAADSKDAARVVARFRCPADGPQHVVRFTCVVPVSETGNHYGGVAIMRPVMGPDKLVGVSLPQMWAYVGAFGRADITKDGSTIAENQPAYAIVTPGIHDPNHQLMSDADSTRQEIHLFVPGSMQPGGKPVTGFPNGCFYIYWPGAAFEMANVGGAVRAMGMEAITVPTPTEMPSGAGPARPAPKESKLLGTVDISLTDTAIRKQIGEAPSGLYDVRVTNNSSRRMGIVYRGTDLCCTEYIRFSLMMRPGQSQTFRWYFAPGKVRMHNFLSARKTARGYTDVNYGSLSSSIVFK